MNKKMIINSAIAGVMALGMVAAKVQAQSATAPTPTAEVKCKGANSCKGSSACKTDKNACKGHNACKGQGWTMMTEEACTKAGGTVAK